MSPVAQAVTPAVAEHGEGPVWDGAALRFVDMLAGDVLSFDPAAATIDRWHVADVAAALRPRRHGGVVIATERGFALAEEIGGPVRVVAKAFDEDGVRMNDGACDPQGRFYCGSMAYDASPAAGALYRLDLDGNVDTVLRQVTVSNGLAWSPDGATCYYIDTATQRIDAFDFEGEQGVLSNRRTLVEVAEHSGAPDGMAVDADGGLWVALWEGAAIHRYTSAGTLDHVVPLPVRQVTACAFGGPGLETLYVTTSRFGLTSPEPEAGALFGLEPGVRGLPLHPYGA